MREPRRWEDEAVLIREHFGIDAATLTLPQYFALLDRIGKRHRAAFKPPPGLSATQARHLAAVRG